MSARKIMMIQKDSKELFMHLNLMREIFLVI